MKICRSHQARTLAQLGKTVEHQHTPAQPIRANLEAGPEARERILSAGPRLSLIGLGLFGVVLAVVKDHFKKPIFWFGRYRCLIGIAYTLQILVRVGVAVRE